jgi:DNA-binding NarL/FixJ family response regulator
MMRVLVVARSPVERAGLEALLTGAGYPVVAPGAASPAQAASLVLSTQPDVVLVLLESGGEVARLTLPPDAEAAAPPLVLLGDDRPGWAMRAVRAGARAALPRTAAVETITAALEAAVAGLVVLPADAVSHAAPQAAGTPHGEPEPLTPREAQILALLADGLGNKVIAARLGISSHTVKTHIAALFQKLGVSTRAEAVAAGARAGVILL